MVFVSANIAVFLSTSVQGGYVDSGEIIYVAFLLTRPYFSDGSRLYLLEVRGVCFW